jgi:hypothetical protein
MPPPLQALITSSLFVFLIGASFWAGTLYNRVSGIEKTLISMDQKISKLGDVDKLQAHVDEILNRLDRYEARFNMLEGKG